MAETESQVYDGEGCVLLAAQGDLSGRGLKTPRHKPKKAGQDLGHILEHHVPEQPGPHS